MWLVQHLLLPISSAAGRHCQRRRAFLVLMQLDPTAVDAGVRLESLWTTGSTNAEARSRAQHGDSGPLDHRDGANARARAPGPYLDIAAGKSVRESVTAGSVAVRTRAATCFRRCAGFARRGCAGSQEPCAAAEIQMAERFIV